MKNKLAVLSLPAVLQTRIFVLLSLAAFTIPFSLGHYQFLTGTLVNTFLFLSVSLLPKKTFWPVVFLPSLAVISRGLIFGPLTIFLVYLLPLIWLGNLTLIFVFSKLLDLTKFPLAIFASALAKCLLLFSFTFLLFNFNILPKLFLTTMGINQFTTAILGGFLAWLSLRFLNNKWNN